MKFNERFEENIKLVDETLNMSVAHYSQYKEEIMEAVSYSLFTGGKRIRPILTLESYRLFSNENFSNVLPYAAAIEMIHTYSLIHDDLPAMDDDDIRRGKPTSHKQFGEAMAILAGDGLLNLAFETVADHMNSLNPDINLYNKNIKAFQELSAYSGISGMIGGQVVDLHLTREEADEDSILFMYKTKTAALIEAALVTGAIIGGADIDDIHIIRNFGYNLGMAYQIKDDFLDLEEDEAIDKVTYISVLGKERAEKDLYLYSEEAISELYRLKNRDIKFLLQLTEKLVDRNI